MTIKVETAYLRGYAKLIDANCDNALAEMARYADAHCRDLEGLNGILHIARPSITAAADVTTDLIDIAQRGLRRTAAELRTSADDYDRSDWSSAERQWVAGNSWEAPWSWRETNVATTAPIDTEGAFRALMAPAYQPEAQEAIDYLKSMFGAVNTVIEKLTGYDLLGTAMPVLLGEWGALKRTAEAYGELEGAWRRIAGSLTTGLDVLSTHWDSTGLGTAGASMAFDFHIRSRWMKSFEALAQMCDTMQQMCESMAAQYEHTVKGLLYLLNFWMAKLAKTVGKIMTATNWAKLGYAVYSLISSVYDLIHDGVTLAIEQVEMFIEGVQMMVATTVTVRHMMNDDFDALKAG